MRNAGSRYSLRLRFMGRKIGLSKYLTEEGVDALIMRDDMEHLRHCFHGLDCFVKSSVDRTESNGCICDEGINIPLESKPFPMRNV